MNLSSDQRWGLLAAVAYGGTAGLVVASIGYLQPDSGGQALGIGAILSAGLIGGYTWQHLVERDGMHPLLGGVASGLVTGSLSHVGMWLVYILVSFGPNPVMLLGMIPFLLFGLFVFGIITVPLAMVTGVGIGLFKLLLRRLRGD